MPTKTMPPAAPLITRRPTPGGRPERLPSSPHIARGPSAPPFSCSSCEIQIVGRPTIHVGLPFCCAGCVVGGPCTCSYEG